VFLPAPLPLMTTYVALPLVNISRCEHEIDLAKSSSIYVSCSLCRFPLNHFSVPLQILSPNADGVLNPLTFYARF